MLPAFGVFLRVDFGLSGGVLCALDFLRQEFLLGDLRFKKLRCADRWRFAYAELVSLMRRLRLCLIFDLATPELTSRGV